MVLVKKIERYELKGWKYETNYNTGNHILEECLIKGDKIKVINNRKIYDYRK